MFYKINHEIIHLEHLVVLVSTESLIGRRFDNNEKKKLCNQSSSIHYYHFISPYHYDSSYKKITFIRYQKSGMISHSAF